MLESEKIDLTYHDFHPDIPDFKLCMWHLLVRHVSKRVQKACRLDIKPCTEEGTETIWTISENYRLCEEHYKLWNGVKEEG